jgi:hypothetical protein
MTSGSASLPHPPPGPDPRNLSDPFSRKGIVGFFVLFLVFYGLLLLPWPGLRQAYAACFRAGGTLLFGSFGAPGAVRFLPAATPATGLDTDVVLINPRNGVSGRTQHDSRHMGYLPTAMLVSLVLATPAPWRRKGRALLWGLVAVNAYVALRIGLVLVRDLSNDDPLRLFTLGPWAHQALAWAVRAVVMSPGSYFAFPVFIWILVTFRRGEWRRLFSLAP